MNKKKHQSEPNDDNSSNSSDDNMNVECSHINKAVDLNRIKKNITRTGYLTECEECKKNPNSENDDELMQDIEFDLSLWLCLKCGNQACGRSKNKHALSHFSTPHSDSHHLCVNTTIWSVWCYGCDNDINMTCKKKLQEAVEYLRKQSETIKSKHSAKSMIESVLETLPTTEKIIANPAGNNLNLPRARGLSNLGNTCFFNSVMQCLGQTPYLYELLDETSKPGQYFKLPGGKLELDNKEVVELPPLDGELEKWKPLPAALADTLRELQSGRNEVYVPRMLLSRLTAKMPQFAGGDQHDSHELLRHLLEGVREEDLKRYKSVILEKLGFSNKTDPSTVEGDKKKIVKFYGQQASEMLLPTEQVFRGVLVSTLQCQNCKHSSHRDEFFLDLSLPITEKQVPPVYRRKADEIEDKPSKYQMKKEKREQKKNKKQKSHRNQMKNNNVINNIVTITKANMENISESESDADVEDNVDDAGASNNPQDQLKGLESGYNSDKIDNSSPDSNNCGSSPDMRVDDSGVPSPVTTMMPASPENSAASSENNVEMEIPSCGRNSPNAEELEEFERPESRLAFCNKNNDLKVDLSKLSLLNQDNSMEACSYYYESSDEKMEEDMDEEEDDTIWTNTISARYRCEPGECSLQSCLNQFTECELLVGSNKVGCELCTKRHGGAEKKTVYTDASKQLLIYNPPAVLILHLKRFQVCRFNSTKVSKTVKFSMLLDLAPFCSKRALSLATFEEGQSKVLYALYGVVEHSGSLHGGHYVAYVKVRPRLEADSYRWNFLPKNQQNRMNRMRETDSDPEVPAGKWYYISDSHVSEVPESKVLNAQAYLLFYERIM